MHDRLSVHNVSFLGSTLGELDGYWRQLGVKRLSLIATQLSEPDLKAVVAAGSYTVEAVTHVFASGPIPTEAEEVAAARDGLRQTIDAAARLGSRSIYLLTGGRGTMTWEQAAEAFSSALAPCVEQARQAGIAMLIENASNLYVDVHLVHTLRDTIALAEMAGTGICIDHFHCWTEPGFRELVARALPLTGFIQLSDYVPGDRSLPARAVPGDGSIPIESFLEQVLAAGYGYGFDLELLGPRIEQEGRFEAVRRAGETVTLMLNKLGA